MMIEEEQKSPQDFSIESKQLNKVLKDLIASICAREEEEIKAPIFTLKEIDCSLIPFNEILGFQFVQKLTFLEKETLSQPALYKIVASKKEDLLNTFKNYFRDTSKFKKIYEEL